MAKTVRRYYDRRADVKRSKDAAPAHDEIDRRLLAYYRDLQPLHCPPSVLIIGNG